MRSSSSSPGRGRVTDFALAEFAGLLPFVRRAPLTISNRMLPGKGEDAQFDAGRSGAQANVIIYTSDKSLLNPIGRLWIKLITLLSYLQ